MVDRILKLILLLTPIIYYPGIFFYKLELIFFQICSILLFMACLLDKPKREFNIGKPLVFYIGICLSSVIINHYDVKSLSALLNILIGCVDLFIIITYVQDLKSCFKWIGYGIILNSIVYIWQLLGYNPEIQYPEPSFEHGGLTGSAPRFASLIALSIPFLQFWYLIPLFILGFLLKEMSIFFAIGCVVYILIIKEGVYDVIKKIGITILVILSIVIILLFKDNIIRSINMRVNIWKEVIAQILNNPFKGWGLANFKIADYAQSSFLQWIHEVGVLGIGFIILMLKKIKWYLLPFVFLCFLEHPFQIPRLWILIICVVSYYTIDIKKEVTIC